MIFVRTIPNVMRYFGCTAEDAARYIDLRDEGYGPEQAAVMAGLRDPAHDEEEQDDTCPGCDGWGGDRMNDYVLPCPVCGQ